MGRILGIPHHDEPAFQFIGVTDGPCGHVRGLGLENLLHQDDAVFEMTGLEIALDGAGRRVDRMDLLGTGAFVIAGDGPASNEAVPGAVVLGNVQIALAVAW